MEHKTFLEGITFDDVLLVPEFSTVTPDKVQTSTRLTANIRLNIPLVSAPMDTVTDARLAIALAQEGGIGIIHKNFSHEVQAREVAKVKRSENGVITDPVTLSPGDTIARALALMDQQNVSGFPVTADGSSHGRVVGILTRRDMKFVKRGTGQQASGSRAVNTPSPVPNATIGDVMTRENLITAPPDTTLEAAEHILNGARVEKLLLVDKSGNLAGLITMRDIDNIRKHPNACRDARGRLRVGAAVGVHQYERVDALIAAEVDVIVVDTAHGHSENVIKTIEALRKRYDIDIIAGNIATEEAARDLIAAGADAVKVGIGPGSICTTRIVSGVGVPQLTAIFNACRAADDADIPVIADGGIRQSGDIAKAIAAGASSVMLGSLFAGLDESPGELILHQGRRFKAYRGMGSAGAMGAGSADRYGQAHIAESINSINAANAGANSDLNRGAGGASASVSSASSAGSNGGAAADTLGKSGGGSGGGKFVPEGVEGRVPYRGSLSEFVYQMVGGLRAAMGYCGCHSIEGEGGLREHARFVRVSAASVIESHPHDIQITKESPNYLPAQVNE